MNRRQIRKIAKSTLKNRKKNIKLKKQIAELKERLAIVEIKNQNRNLTL